MSELKVTWEKIIVNEKPIVKFINLGNGTQFKLVSFFIHSKLFVALERLGAFFFDCHRFKSGEYVSEKLNICIADANIIADWINVQLDVYDKQQGYYSLNYIEVEEMHFTLFTTVHPIVLKTPENIIPSNKTEEHGLSKTFYEDH